MVPVGLPSLLRVPVVAACVAAIGLGVAGCATTGSTTKNTVSNGIVASGGTLAIYVAPPLGGGQAATDVFDAEKLAAPGTGAKVGPYSVQMKVATGSEVSALARSAVSDKSTIAYLGEIEPGASAVSAQITNELDILQVSPTDTAAYLTQAVAGVAGSPQHFYPDHKSYGETFARVTPDSAAEAQAIVTDMKKAGVTTLTVADDGSQYGAAIASEVRADAGQNGISVGSGSGAATFYGGLPGTAATRALDAAAAASPTAKLFAPSGLYDDSFVSGLSAAAQKSLTVSAPGFMAAGLDAAGRTFAAKFQSTYGHAPAPQAIFGYEAMQAVIATLQSAGTQAAVRKTVVSDFRSLKRTASDSALGAYAVNGGDSDVNAFVFARVVDGALVPRTAG